MIYKLIYINCENVGFLFVLLERVYEKYQSYIGYNCCFRMVGDGF